MAKKIWHRGAQFTARDIFDLAMVSEWEPEALKEIFPILREKREVVLRRITGFEPQLRETFDELLILEYQRSFDECVEIVKNTLSSA